jgi:hypothetical protein
MNLGAQELGKKQQRYSSRIFVPGLNLVGEIGGQNSEASVLWNRAATTAGVGQEVRPKIPRDATT